MSTSPDKKPEADPVQAEREWEDKKFWPVVEHAEGFLLCLLLVMLYYSITANHFAK
jgi:hypothetical protein